MHSATNGSRSRKTKLGTGFRPRGILLLAAASTMVFLGCGSEFDEGLETPDALQDELETNQPTDELAETPASDLAIQSCRSYANTPQFYGYDQVIVAWGGRRGCSDTTTIHVRLREDRKWRPDRTLAQRWVTGVNEDVGLNFVCTGTSTWRKFFTETIVNGKKTKSRRVQYPCSF